MRYVVAGIFLILAACAAPPSAPGPASLQVVAPTYYSRTLHYIVRERRSGRVVERAYDIPVQIETKTGEVRVQEPPAATAEDRQIGVIQRRLENMKERLDAK
jgi:hypothetical protein